MKKVWIAALVVAGAAVLAGIGVLTWYLLQSEDEPNVATIQLEGRLGDIEQEAAFTRIRDVGDVFWWFYPSLSFQGTRPIILWLDGVTDLPPSLSANIGAFGPYDANLNRRNDSWVNNYNLLFIDSPVGTGFSTALDEDAIPGNVEENAEHLLLTLESFFSLHPELAANPLYVFGQGHGAQLALALALRLQQEDAMEVTNLQGVALGNGIVDPGLALSRLGFYLEEMGYIYAPGREAIETLAADTQEHVLSGQLAEAFENFASLGEAVNQAGAVAVNLRHIVEKLYEEPSDTFGQAAHLKSVQQIDGSLAALMNSVVAPALGIEAPQFDSGRDAVLRAFSDSFMTPASSLVTRILETTNLTVTIYNGNLDAVSNTPGQLEWVENLQWAGTADFRSQPRQLLVLNQQLEGYFRRSERLRFYWINAAGQSVPLDSPAAMRRVVASVVGEN